MSIFKTIFGAVTSPLGLVKNIADVVDRFITTGDEKLAFASKRAEFEADLLGLVSARDAAIEQTLRTEIQAKERILVAELQQGDKFTKRARPSLVYVGLLFALAETVVRVVLVLQGQPFPEGLTTVVPPPFWAAWTGVTGAWVIGRTAERRGLQGRIVESITGRARGSVLD